MVTTTGISVPTIPGPDSNTTQPSLTVPKGACDCHAHIFGPQIRYPYHRMNSKDLISVEPMLQELPVDVVIDHMGQVPVEPGLGGRAFRTILRLVKSGKCWVKLSAPMRMSNKEKMMPVILRIAKCAVVALLLQSGLAAAQSYPSGPLRMIVPFPPGGGTDTLARIIAQKLNEAWGQPVVVDNRGGANGTIGAALAARADPDGHTMLIAVSGFAANPSIYKNLPFDSIRDLAPVTQFASNPSVLAIHPSLPVRTVKELIAFVKARPNEVDYASSGNGSPPHLNAEMFKLMTATRMTHVPYKGGGPATVAVVAGEVPVYFMAPPQAAPFLKSGRLRALAVTSEKRDPGFPDLPTVAEAGVPGFAMTNWYGLFVPAGTPDAALRKLHAEMVRIVNLPDVKARLARVGNTVVGSTPEEFAAFLKAEIARIARVVKAAGITASN